MPEDKLEAMRQAAINAARAVTMWVQVPLSSLLNKMVLPTLWK